MNSLSSKDTLILDGAMGTELMRRGIDLPLPYWSSEANHTNPEAVLSIHEEYINAGADIITTNTFRTTPRTYRNAEYSMETAKALAKERLQQAVELALKASKESIVVAGSIAPLEECYQPELAPVQNIIEEEFTELYSWLIEYGVDFVLFETMGNISEIKSAVNITRKHSAKSILSLLIKNESSLFDDTPLVDVFTLIEDANFEAVLFNCVPLNILPGAIKTLKKHWDRNWGVYPNLGKSMPSAEGEFDEFETNENFIKQIDFYLKNNVKIIGSCCGSTPKHTKLIKAKIEADKDNE
jgi:homocysteine S-methyltransferase